MQFPLVKKFSRRNKEIDITIDKKNGEESLDKKTFLTEIEKEQKEMLELLAAGVTRMNCDEEAVNIMQGIAGEPIRQLPQLFCEILLGRMIRRESGSGLRRGTAMHFQTFLKTR